MEILMVTTSCYLSIDRIMIYLLIHVSHEDFPKFQRSSSAYAAMAPVPLRRDNLMDPARVRNSRSLQSVRLPSCPPISIRSFVGKLWAI